MDFSDVEIDVFFGISDVNGDGNISTDVSSSSLLFVLHDLQIGKMYLFYFFFQIRRVMTWSAHWRKNRLTKSWTKKIKLTWRMGKTFPNITLDNFLSFFPQIYLRKKHENCRHSKKLINEFLSRSAKKDGIVTNAEFDVWVLNNNFLQLKHKWNNESFNVKTFHKTIVVDQPLIEIFWNWRAHLKLHRTICQGIERSIYWNQTIS